MFGCSNGTEIYSYSSEHKDYIRSSILAKLEAENQKEKEEWYKEAVKIVSEILGRDDVNYEVRSETMGVIVCLPRDASEEERKAFDPDKKKRRKCISAIKHLFPENYDIVAGGSTSIDIGTFNKRAGMMHLRQNQDWEHGEDKTILYFGDNFFEHGNDASVAGLQGVTCVAVTCAEDTLRLLQNFIYDKNA